MIFAFFLNSAQRAGMRNISRITPIRQVCATFLFTLLIYEQLRKDRFAGERFIIIFCKTYAWGRYRGLESRATPLPCGR
jgi:hypothetical protein